MFDLNSRQIISAIAVVSASVALSGAQAQVGTDSEWTTAEGDIRIRANATSHYPRDNWRSGMGARRDAGPLAYIEMQGSYQNLRWQGEYWIMGAADGWRPANTGPAYRPSACVASRPNGYTVGDDANDYGEYDITFNAAENAFTGQKRWVCRSSDGRARKGAWEPFNGTRKGYVAAGQHTAPVPTAPINPNPSGSGGTSGSGSPRSNPLGDCVDFTRVELIIDGTLVRPDRRYGIRPCQIDAASFEKFQIDFINPEGKRPTQLLMKAFRLMGTPQIRPDRSSIVVPAVYSGKRAQQSLPFMGEPRAGSAWFNLLMPGSFCNSPFWIASFRFSDGSESAPFTFLFSECGARNHPEELPRSDSSPEAVRVKDVRPRD